MHVDVTGLCGLKVVSGFVVVYFSGLQAPAAAVHDDQVLLHEAGQGAGQGAGHG